jgi:ribosomal protein S27AE
MEADQFGDLWTCPRCGRRFANRDQTNACGRCR